MMLRGKEFADLNSLAETLVRFRSVSNGGTRKRESAAALLRFMHGSNGLIGRDRTVRRVHIRLGPSLARRPAEQYRRSSGDRVALSMKSFLATRSENPISSKGKH